MAKETTQKLEMAISVGTRALLSGPMNEWLKKGELIPAIIRASIDIELILFYKLFFEKKMDIPESNKATLGKYIKQVEKYKLLKGSDIYLLKQFHLLRNNVVHFRGYMELIYRDKEELRKTKKMLKQIKHFIRQARIKTSMERERIYTKMVTNKINSI